MLFDDYGIGRASMTTAMGNRLSCPSQYTTWSSISLKLYGSDRVTTFLTHLGLFRPSANHGLEPEIQSSNNHTFPAEDAFDVHCDKRCDMAAADTGMCAFELLRVDLYCQKQASLKALLPRPPRPPSPTGTLIETSVLIILTR
ncbi:hypothetical protein N7G274_005970 [Stereocaulon virgatum]|uniref:Uncharacterized protein n=1 Tax=Stereocaulon virgatum TaxID=373712 RepID=A0ABR4ADX1_9LECA